jgi:hypothetical protein
MNTTTPLIKPPPPPSAGNLPSATTSTRAAHSEAPTIGEVLGVDLPLIGIVPYGLPPLILVAGWVLLALALTGPFLLLVTIALATGIVVAITAAILAPPYLLARSLHRYRTRRPNERQIFHRVRERHPTGHGSPTQRRAAGLINPPAAQIPATAQLYTPAHVHSPVHLHQDASSPHLGVNASQSLPSP